MSQKRKVERNKRALELRKQGMMFKDIAKELGLCYARAWTVVKNQERWEAEENETDRV